MVGECEAQEGGQEKMKERKTSGKWSCMEAGRRTAGGAECGSVRAHVPQRSSSSTVLLLLPPSDTTWSPSSHPVLTVLLARFTLPSRCVQGLPPSCAGRLALSKKERQDTRETNAHESTRQDER